MSAAGTQTVGIIEKDNGGSPTQIQQLTTIARNPGVAPARHGHSGNISPTHATVLSKSPSIAISGTGLKMLIDTFGLKDYDLGNSSNELDVYIKDYVQGGTRASTGTKLSVSKGLAFMQSISAAHGPDPAVGSAIILPDSTDGAANPITLAAGNSITADNYTQNFYGMGKVVLASTAMIGVLSWGLNLGNVEIRRSADGDIYITHTSLLTHAPSLTVQVMDMKQFMADFADSGQATDLVFYLRHQVLGVGWTVDATTSHIKFTAYEGTYHLDEDSVAHDADGSGSVTINLVDDQSNGALTVSTASAIT